MPPNLTYIFLNLKEENVKISILAAIATSVFLTSNAFGEQSVSEAYGELMKKQELEAKISMARFVLESKNLNPSDFTIEANAEGDVFVTSDQYLCKLDYGGLHYGEQVTMITGIIINSLNCYQKQAPYEYESWY